MNIESIQHYLKAGLPAAIRAMAGSFTDALYWFSPYVYLSVIALLAVLVALTLRRMKKNALLTKKKTEFLSALSQAGTLHRHMSVLGGFLKDIDPGVRTVGIYRKTGTGLTLIHSPGDMDSGAPSGPETGMDVPAPSGDGFRPEQFISLASEYEKRGRYYIHTFAPGERNTAVRIISYNNAKHREISPELGYFIYLAELMDEKEKAAREIEKTSILMKSRELFSNPLFNDEIYFRFIGKVILNANGYDNVQIDFGGRTIDIGSGECPPERSKTLFIRNTDVKVRIFRKSELSQEDITSSGRFLNVISAMIAFYSEQSRNDLRYFLEEAVKTSESKGYNAGHSARVEAVSMALGGKMGLSGDRLEDLRTAARLHDIGMMADVSDIIGRNPAFSQREYDIIKYHPLIGSVITTPLGSVHRPVSNIILQHHEMNDGSGYPFGIRGEEILVESGILALSEIFVGLISNRPHRKGHPPEKAIGEMISSFERKLNPEVLKSFMQDKYKIIALLR